jgi:hypothetical protein
MRPLCSRTSSPQCGVCQTYERSIKAEGVKSGSRTEDWGLSTDICVRTVLLTSLTTLTTLYNCEATVLKKPVKFGFEGSLFRKLLPESAY